MLAKRCEWCARYLIFHTKCEKKLCRAAAKRHTRNHADLLQNPPTYVAIKP